MNFDGRSGGARVCSIKTEFFPSLRDMTPIREAQRYSSIRNVNAEEVQYSKLGTVLLFNGLGRLLYFTSLTHYFSIDFKSN